MLRLKHCSSYVTPLSCRPPVPSWNTPWTSSTGYSSFKTIQEGQYTSDPPETCWAARETKRTVWQSPLSQRSTSPEGARTSPVLPEQASHRPHQMDNRYCGWDTRIWMILHDQRPQWQSLQKESSSFKAHLSRWLLLSRPSSDKRGKTAQRQFLSRPSGQIHVFQQQRELHWRQSQLYGHPVHDVWWPETRQTPLTSPATSPPRRHSPRSPSYSLPASLPIQRVISWAQLRGLLTRGQEETPVWTSLHQTPWHWPRTHTWPFSSPSWNITFGTLSMTVTGQGPRKNHHPKMTSF